MLFRQNFSWLIAFIFAFAPSALAKIDLAVLGPVYQPPKGFAFQAFDDAKSQATKALNQIIATGNSTYGPLDTKGTSFSASVFSLSSNEPLYEFHFEAPGLAGSYTKGKLSENTIYRTGSLGKLLTVYTWLVDIGDDVFLDPITKYIPELDAAAQACTNLMLCTNWTEVTVGSLASQISGIGRDFHLGDLAVPSFQSPPVDIAVPNGYPPLDNESITQCNAYGYLPTCTRTQFLDGVMNHPPAYLSYATPAYSNIAYAILSLAYEAITGKSINQGQIDLYQGKLGMKSTSPTYPGPDADAVIPRNDSYAIFSYDIGIESPAGGQYITTKDLRTWGQAILNSMMLPPTLTRRWMKPHSLTSQWEAVVGAPWEIFRIAVPSNSIINADRLVDTYTKSGDIGLYSTYFGLVPDYDMGISVLTAGDNPNRQVPPVRGTLVEIFYQAFESASKQQALTAFTGTYRSHALNSSITFAVDGGPGVSITSWISNSTDFLANFILSNFNDFRIYPSNLEHADEGTGIIYRKYQMIVLADDGEPEPPTGDPWSEKNDAWYGIDSIDYNNLATTAFVVGFDGDGMVQSVESQALRTVMYRAS